MIKKLFLFNIILCLAWNVYAKEYNISQALERFKSLKLKKPNPEPDGRVQTLNKKGAMAPNVDRFIVEGFMQYGKNKRALDIGGGYGDVMITMLKRHPQTIYHLNDLDERHLFIAAYEAHIAKVQKTALEKALFIGTDFLRMSQHRTYDAILISRVLHFFSPDKLSRVIQKIFHLLRPGGKVYVLAMTPYIKRYKSFIPEYEKRLCRNDPYPGYVQSLHTWVNHSAISASQLKQISPEPFMFLDDKVLSMFFKNAGFYIKKCCMVPLSYQSPLLSLDGRENVILVAKKPSIETVRKRIKN